MIILGITGGVGAGKSTVLSFLASHCHAHIIEADRVAKELMLPGGATYEPLLSLFGGGIQKEDGSIDPGKMAKAMYADPNLIREVDAIVHPRVKEAIQKQLASLCAPLAVIEAALLAEGDLIPLCHQVWYIRVPEEVRMQRLMSSRGYSPEKCRQIFDSQSSDAEFLSLADVVIQNDSAPADTYRQIKEALKELGLEVEACS